MSEFEKAVSATRSGSATPTKAYPDASGGTLGGSGWAGEEYSTGGEFEAAHSLAKRTGNVPVSEVGPSAGLGSGVDSGTSQHSYTPGSEAMAGYNRTCQGEAAPTKNWPDAPGGGLGKS